MISPVNRSELFASLPAPWPEDLSSAIRAMHAASRRKLVVLDDDPTGTQTVYDVPVLTTWQPAELAREFANDLPCFYILTNTRAFPAAEAVRINEEIAHNLIEASMQTSERHGFVVVSRGDSTLRGHYPLETDVLGRALAMGGMPPLLLVPYFEAGGRYTVNDVHYVAEHDTLIPAGETPFAKDPAFGYHSSNLREWVEEKSGGRVKASEVKSISLDDLRIAGPDVVKAKLLSLADGGVCIVNAAAPRDLEVLALATLQAENAGRLLVYRTAASFVAARLGLVPKEPWCPKRRDSAETNGGLVIVGSHVPKTTLQLESLLAKCDVECVELSVEGILNAAQRGIILEHAVERANTAVLCGRDVVVFTSRTRVTGCGAEESLAIGNRVSAALVALLRGTVAKPRFIIAKGGITSSDLATHALGVKRAMVLGQILPGIPVWELGSESKFPGVPFVVFPGNVGGPDMLAEVVNKFNRERPVEKHSNRSV
jgi:uncharacterized protein YgbK (DUF1537 family)